MLDGTMPGRGECLSSTGMGPGAIGLTGFTCLAGPGFGSEHVGRSGCFLAPDFCCHPHIQCDHLHPHSAFIRANPLLRAMGCIPPVSASAFPWFLIPVCLFLYPLEEHLSLDLEPTWIIQDALKILNLLDLQSFFSQRGSH